LFARSGSITIAGLRFSVAQQSNIPCSYAVSPTRPRFFASAKNAKVTVSTGANCDWSAVSNASWITIVGSAAGRGSGAVSYAIAALPAQSIQRTGTLTIAGKTVTVLQAK